MKLSVADFLRRGIFPKMDGKKEILLGLILFLMVFPLIGTPLRAQSQFSIPEHLESIEYDQGIDLSSWNHFNRVEGLFTGALDIGGKSRKKIRKA